MPKSSTLKEFGARHHIGLTKIYEEINSGDLHVYKIGSCQNIAINDASISIAKFH